MESPSLCPDMASEDETDFAEAVVTCEGNLHDPDFSTKFQLIVDKLKRLLYKSKKEEAFKVRKIEPWNSVRVTISIPKDAAQRLRTLAQQGNQVLRQLGILSVQVEGDQVISLTLAGKNNEPQEVVLTQPDGSGPSSSLTSSFSIPSASSFLSSLVPNSQNPPHRQNQASSSSSPHPSQHNFHQQSSLTAPTLQSQGNGGLPFVSPNVVAPGGEPIPSLPKTGAVSTPRPLHGGPFSFSSMTHAVHTLQRSDSLTLCTPPSSGGKSPIPSSSPSYSSCQSAGTSSNNLTSTNRAPPVLQGTPQTVLSTPSDQTRFIYSSSGSAGVNAHSNLNLVNSSSGQNQSPTSSSSSLSSNPTSQSLQLQFVEATPPPPTPPPYPHQPQQQGVQFRLPQGQFQQPNNNSSGVIANSLPSDKPISSPLLVNLLQHGEGGSPTSPVTPNTPRPPSAQGTAEDARTSMPPPPLSISLSLENPKVKRYQLIQQQRKMKRGMSLDMQGSPISPAGDMSPAPNRSPTSVSEPASPVSSPMMNEGTFNQPTISDSQLMSSSNSSGSVSFSESDQGQVRQMTLYQQGGNFRIVNQAQMMSQQQQQQYQGQGVRFSQNQLPVSHPHTQQQQPQNQLMQQQQQQQRLEFQQGGQNVTHVNGPLPPGSHQQMQRYQFFPGQDNTMRMNQGQGYGVQIQRPQTPSPHQMQGNPQQQQQQQQGGLQHQAYTQQQQQQQVTYQTNVASQQRQQQFIQMQNTDLQQMKQEYLQTGIQSHQSFSHQNQQFLQQNTQNQQNSAQAQRNLQFNNQQQQQQQTIVRQTSQFQSQSSHQQLVTQNPQNPGAPLQQRQMVIQNYQQQRTQFVMQNSQVSSQSQGQANSQLLQNQQQPHSQMQNQQSTAQQNFMLQQQYIHQRQQQQQQMVLQQNAQQQHQQQQNNNQPPPTSGVTTPNANRMMMAQGQGQTQFRNFIPPTPTTSSSATFNPPDSLQQQQEQCPVPPPPPQQVVPTQNPVLSSPPVVPTQTAATFVAPSAPPPRLISTMYRAILNSQTDDDDTMTSTPSQHGGKKIRRIVKPHPSGGKPKLLLNPLTGHLEPIPGERGSSSESEEDEEDGRKGKGKGPRGKSISRPKGKGKDLPTTGAAGGKPMSSLGKPGAFDSARARNSGATTFSSQSVGPLLTPAELPQSHDPSLTGEKIKLRLKLEKDEPAYKVDVSYSKKAEKSTSSFPGFPAASEGGSDGFGNSSVSGSPADQPRVPPLHISLRGKNSAVVVSPRRDETSIGSTSTYNPNIPPPPLTPKPGSSYPVVSTNSVDFTALFPSSQQTSSIAEQGLNFKPAKGKKSSKASRPKINKESSSNPFPLPTSAASSIPGKIRSKSKSTTSMPLDWKPPNLDSQLDSVEIGIGDGKAAGKPKTKNTRRKSENLIAKGGFGLVPMSRSDISAHVREFLPEFSPKITEVKAENHSSVIVGKASISAPELPQEQPSAPSRSEKEMEVDGSVAKAQSPVDDFKISPGPSCSKSDVFREAFVKHNNTLPTIVNENDQLISELDKSCLEARGSVDEKPVRHTIRPIPDLLALPSKAVSNLPSSLVHSIPVDSPPVNDLLSACGKVETLHQIPSFPSQDRIVQELLEIPSMSCVAVEKEIQCQVQPDVPSGEISEEVREGILAKLDDAVMEKMDDSELSTNSGDPYVDENVSLLTLPIIPSSEQTGNGNGAAGEDSGIDSMDALSEKSPNQGESPVRKESENNFIPSSENEHNNHALETEQPVMEQAMDVDMELQLLTRHSTPPPLEDAGNDEIMGDTPVDVGGQEKEKTETEEATKEIITKPLENVSVEAEIVEAPIPGETTESENISELPTPVDQSPEKPEISDIEVTEHLPVESEPEAIVEAKDLLQIEGHEAPVILPAVDDQIDVLEKANPALQVPESGSVLESSKELETVTEIGVHEVETTEMDLPTEKLETALLEPNVISEERVDELVQCDPSDVEEPVVQGPYTESGEVAVEKLESEITEHALDPPTSFVTSADPLVPISTVEHASPIVSDDASACETEALAEMEPEHGTGTAKDEIDPEESLKKTNLVVSQDDTKPQMSSMEEIKVHLTQGEMYVGEVQTEASTDEIKSAAPVEPETVVDEKPESSEMEIKPEESGGEIVERMETDASTEVIQEKLFVQMTKPEEVLEEMELESSGEEPKSDPCAEELKSKPFSQEGETEAPLEEIKTLPSCEVIRSEVPRDYINSGTTVEVTKPQTLTEAEVIPVESEIPQETLNLESPEIQAEVTSDSKLDLVVETRNDPPPAETGLIQESETERIVQDEAPIVPEVENILEPKPEEETVKVPAVVPEGPCALNEIVPLTENVGISAEEPVDGCEHKATVQPELVQVVEEVIETPARESNSVTLEIHREEKELEEEIAAPVCVDVPIVEIIPKLEAKKEAVVIFPAPKPAIERQTSSITVDLPDVEILHTTVVSPTSVITHIVATPAAVVTLPRDPPVEAFVSVPPPPTATKIVLPQPFTACKPEPTISESTKTIVPEPPVPKPIGSVHPIQKPKSKFIARKEKAELLAKSMIVPATIPEVTVQHAEIIKTEVTGGQSMNIAEQSALSDPIPPKAVEVKKSPSTRVETKRLEPPISIRIEPSSLEEPPKTVIIKTDSCGRISKEPQSVSPISPIRSAEGNAPPTERVVPVSILPRFDQSPQKPPQRFFVQSSSGVLSPLPNLVRPTQPGQPSQGVIRPIPIPPLEFKPVMKVPPGSGGEEVSASQVNETPGPSGAGRGRLGLEAIISALGGKNASEPGIQRYPIPAQPHGNLLNINRFPVNVIQVSNAGLSSPPKHQNIISIPGGASGSGQTMFTIPANLSHQFQVNHQTGITVLPSGQKVVPIKLLQLPKGTGPPVVRAGTNQNLQPNRSSPTIIDLSNRSGSPQIITQRVGSPRPIQTTPMNLSNVGGNIKLVPISANHAQLQKVLVSSPIKTGNVVSGNMIQMMMNANSKAGTSVQVSQSGIQQGQLQPTTIRVVRPGGGFVDLRREPTTGALTMSQHSLDQLQFEGALKQLPMSFTVPPQPTPPASQQLPPPVTSIHSPPQPILIPKEIPASAPPAEVNPPAVRSESERTENETEDEEEGLEDEEFGYEGDIIHDEQDVAVALASATNHSPENHTGDTAQIMQNGIDSHGVDTVGMNENFSGSNAIHIVDSGVSNFTSLAHGTADFGSGGDTGDLHGEDQEIIDSFSGQVSSPEEDHQDSGQGEPETDHTYVGKQRNGKSKKKQSHPKVNNMGELSIEIPATDLHHSDFEEEIGSVGDEERKQPVAARSTRSNTRIVSVSPDITALTTSRTETPKLPPPVAKINNTRELRNSPKPSPTGSHKRHSPSAFSPGLSTVSNCHGTGGSSSPVPSHLLKTATAAAKNKRKRRGSDSSSASKDENGEEGQQKVELIDLNARPGKRRCSENAAELIKACIGLEDTPKRNTMLIKRLEDAKAKEKSKKATLSLVEEIDAELGSVDFGRGGRSSRGSSEDRSSSRGSSVNRHPLPSKAQQKEDEKETKRNARANHRNTNTPARKKQGKTITVTPNKVNHEAEEKKKGVSKVPQKSKQNVTNVTVGKGRGATVKKENITGNDKASTPAVSPEIENPRRKTRSSVMTGGMIDSDGPGGKRRRIGKD